MYIMTTPSALIDDGPVFLKKKINLIVVLAVVLTNLFGWFNPNSWLIGALVACRLFDGKPLTVLKNAFTNKVFLVFLVYFLVDVAGFLYTHDPAVQGRTITKEATIVAVAFAFCGGRFADQKTFRQLVTAYTLMLLLSSLYCLVIAYQHFLKERSLHVFFYQELTKPTSFNAVFFSVYVVCGIVFLLSPNGDPAIGWLPPGGRMTLRFLLVLFFLGMILLLSSRLLLAVTLGIMLNAFVRRYSYRKNKATFIIGGTALVLTLTLLIIFDKPIQRRFGDMIGDLSVVKREKFYPTMYFNTLQSRLVEWRFAREILETQHAWLFGVSPGDSQNLLDQKYIDANMDIGLPEEGINRKLRGFLGYNFHNQYVEALVRGGVVGLAALLSVFIVLAVAVRQHGAKEGWYVLFTIAVFFMPEAPLTMQHGVFLFCFLPLMALGAPPVIRHKP